MHYVSLRKVWKKVIKNKEVEGKKKKERDGGTDRGRGQRLD